MSRIFIFSLAFLAVLLVSTHGQGCGMNEKFTYCGTACEPTCHTPYRHVCDELCVVGCQCRQGYLRNVKKMCVEPQDC